MSVFRLIQENEQLLAPSPVLLKRRAYHRQHAPVTQQHSVGLLPETAPTNNNNKVLRTQSLFSEPRTRLEQHPIANGLIAGHSQVKSAKRANGELF